MYNYDKQNVSLMRTITLDIGVSFRLPPFAIKHSSYPTVLICSKVFDMNLIYEQSPGRCRKFNEQEP